MEIFTWLFQCLAYMMPKPKTTFLLNFRIHEVVKYAARMNMVMVISSICSITYKTSQELYSQWNREGFYSKNKFVKCLRYQL